jgi:hypothetical protein
MASKKPESEGFTIRGEPIGDNICLPHSGIDHISGGQVGQHQKLSSWYLTKITRAFKVSLFDTGK